MGILKDLYYNHGDLFGKGCMDSPEYRKCVADVAEREGDLINSHPEVYELFMMYQKSQGRLNNMTEYEMFAAGFRMGSQLMLEMIKE